MTEMNDNDFMSMGAAPQTSQPAEMSDDAFMGMGQPKPSTAADIGKTLAGNVAPTAAANYAANLASPAATLGSYALQGGMTVGKYAGEGIDELTRLASGQPQLTQSEYDQNSRDLMNAVRSKIGMGPTDSGDLSSVVPTPSNLVSGAAKLAGSPLYQPKTQTGKDVESLGNIASGGLGSGIKTIPTIAGAVAGTFAPQGVKAMGGTQAEQDLAGIAAGLGAGVAGEKMAGMPSETPMSNAEDAATNTLMTSDPAAPKLGSEDLRARAKPYYDYAKGVSFTPDAQNMLPDMIDDSMAATGKMNDRLHGDTLSVLGDLKDDAAQGNLDMETAHQYRQLFGDVINNNLHPNGKMKPDAMKANQAIDAIDDFLDKAKNNPDDMLQNGSPDQIDAWQKAQQLWGASARANDIERIMQRAELMQNPATSMRQGFATLAGNPKRFNRFAPDQQDLIRDAAQTSLGAETMRAIGSRLVTYAMLGHGNPLGAVAAIPISAAGRSLAGSMQAVRGQKVIDNITGNAPGEFVAPAAKPAPLQLPPPAINVPATGFGAQPAPEPAPDVNYNPSQRALPVPREMSYEDMVKSGRILDNPSNMPIAVPSEGFNATYNPHDLNAGDEVQQGIAGSSPADIEARLYKKVNRNFPAAVDEYNAIPDTKGGKVMSTDSARELSSDYLQDRTQSAAVHEPASSFVKRLYQQKLAEPPKDGEDPVVLFTSGGTGSGKSTAVKDALGDSADKAQIIYDTNMNKFDASKQKIEDALNAGKGVNINHVYRDPVDALANGALPRAERQAQQYGSGRTVPLQEHINTHVGSLNTIKRLAEYYKDDPRVNFTVLDNSYGKGQAKQIPLASLPKIDQTGLKQRLMEVLDGQYNEGKISAGTYRGSAGKAPQGSQGVRPQNIDVSQGLGSAALRQSEPEHTQERPDELKAKLGGLSNEFSDDGQSDPARTPHASGGQIVHARKDNDVSGVRGTESKKKQGFRAPSGAERVSADDETPTVSEWSRLLYKTRKKGYTFTARDRMDLAKVAAARKAVK